MADESEAQARLLARHGLEADLVDDDQQGLQVLLAAQPSRRQVGVALLGREQVLEPVEHDAEAELDRAHAERDGKLGLAHTR